MLNRLFFFGWFCGVGPVRDAVGGRGAGFYACVRAARRAHRRARGMGRLCVCGCVDWWWKRKEKERFGVSMASIGLNRLLDLFLGTYLAGLNNRACARAS